MITQAKAVDTKSTSLQPAINEASLNLKTQYSSTIKNSFTTAANTATEAYNKADTGLEVGKFALGTKNKLKAVIDVTAAVYNVLTASEEDLWAQVQKISPAVDRYNARRISVSTGNLNGNDRFDIGDLTVIQYYYLEKVTESSLDIIKKADINDDNEIGLVDLQYVAQRVLAN